MEILVEKNERVTVVTPGGRMDGTGAPEVEACCINLIQEGAIRILLDMGPVEYISSAGLRSLLVLGKATQKMEGQVVLCSLTPAVREVMTISGFDRIFALTEDRAAGMETFR